jgi:hypothetical protein
MTPQAVAIQSPETELANCLEQLKCLLIRTGAASSKFPLELRPTPSQERPPTLVVAGETRRGKSAFINALLAVPQLSPSGLTEITNAYTIFSLGMPAQASVVYQDDRKLRVPLPELSEWVTEGKNPGNFKQVAYVHATVDAPLLTDFTVVDTPGIGSVHAAHGAMTIAALEQADCLLLVTDPTAPLTRVELEFLARAATKIESITIVLTKIDGFPGWETIFGHDADLLAEVRGRSDAPALFAASSKVAMADLCDPKLRHESGLVAIEEHLRQQMASSSARLISLNRVRQSMSLLLSLDQEFRSSNLAVSSDAIDHGALQREEQRLREVGDNATIWTRAIDLRLAQLSQRHGDWIQEELRKIEASQLEELATGGPGDAEALIAAVTRRISRLAEDVHSDTLKSVDDILLEILADLDLEEFRDLLADRSRELPEANWRVASPAERGANSYDRMMMLSSFSSGRFIGASVVPLAASVGIGLGPLGLVLGLGVGVIAAGIASHGRRRMVRDGDIRNWLSKQMAVANSRLVTQDQRLISTLGPALRERIFAHIRSEQLRIQKVVEIQKSALTRSSEERATQQARITQDLKDLAELYGRFMSVKTLLLHNEISERN